jgi:peptidylprolyl isomerase
MPAKKDKKSETAKIPVKSEAATGADAVVKGSKVKIDYTGSFEDGEVFDSSERHGKPLEFEAGAGHVIPGFDRAVIGMKKGEEKSVKILPADAYGDVNPELVKEFPRDRLPKEQEPKPGMMLVVGLPNGMQLPARIVDVKGEIVKIDLNHPLAGKTLNFKCKIVEINK